MYHAAPMKTPFLLAIEGIDGAGKTTLSQAMAAELRRCGYRVVTAKEPTQGPFGRQLRESARTGRLPPQRELELLLADREQHVREVIRPELDAGAIVILDRYYLSNAAYQGAEGLDPDAIIRANQAIAPAPDLVILLDVPPETGLARISARGDAANTFEQQDALERCRAIFLKLRDAVPTAAIDATMDAESVRGVAMKAFIDAFSVRVQRVHGVTSAADECLQPLRGGACGAAAR